MWALTMDKCAVIVHLATDEPVAIWLSIQRTATHQLRTKHGAHFVNVQVEPYDDYMTQNKCIQCVTPDLHDSHHDIITGSINTLA